MRSVASLLQQPGVVQLFPGRHEHDGDQSLVARALEGAAWAKAALFRRHAPRLIGFLTRLLNSTSDAEDASQDVFVEAFRDLAGLKDPSGFGSWVTRIAVHQAHRRFRRRRLLRAIGLSHVVEDATLEQIADDRVSPESRAELALLQKALDRLPLMERTAFMLRHIEGYELTEVAHLLDCSLATAKRKISAAQQAMSKDHSHE